MRQLQKDYRVKTVLGNMCMYGMTSEDELGIAPVKKDTGFMTNARMISQRLQRRCDGSHRHVNLINGRAKAAQVYPEELCAEILRGFIDQLKWDGRLRKTAVGMVFAVEEGEQEFMFYD